MQVKTIIRFIIVCFGYFFVPISFGFFLYFFNEMNFIFFKEKNESGLTIYDCKNKLLTKYDQTVVFKKIPSSLFHAFISIEDTTFLSHCGISIRSIIRSVLMNIKEKKFVQGGSTITQQYIKLYYGDLQKTFYRKIKEILIAIILEAIHSKETIFESYCNILYFGKNITGVANCSRTLFNKEYTQLEIDEAALLAGIVQRPEHYNPIKNKEAAIKRRNLVLKRMYHEGYITKKEFDQNIQKKTKIYCNNFFNHNSPIYRLTENDIKSLGHQPHHEYEITTSINEKIQKITYQIFIEHIQNIKKKAPTVDGAIVIIDRNTGGIVSLVDGINSTNSKNQTPFYWKRQIGSIIKPLIIYYALLKGDNIHTQYDDSPLDKNIFHWNPKNHYNNFLGDINLEKALRKSNNIIPIKILHKYGIKEFITLIQPFFQTPINPYYSIALGCIEATILEIANLYYSFLQPHNKIDQKKISYITKIIKKSGGIIYSHEDYIEKSFFLKEHSDEIFKILEKIGETFKKKYNIKVNDNIYIKTGTTNDSISCWCVCIYKQYLMVSFLGTPENTKLYKQCNIIGSNSVAPLCLEIIKRIDNFAE